jgi:hypothetical protein
VVSDGPGWIVIHIEAAGATAPVIGWTAVKDGLTRNLAVKIDAAKATPVLYAMLHTDAGKVGTYEFPGRRRGASRNGHALRRSPPAPRILRRGAPE